MLEMYTDEYFMKEALKEAKEYIEGWKETHPEDDMTIAEAKILCAESNEDMEAE